VKNSEKFQNIGILGGKNAFGISKYLAKVD
jgi:hypothetical protein